MQRRLAAIVHADLAGFTRMMEGAETRTFRHLKSAQIEVWRPAIDAGNGRLVGTAGDAMLAEFGSAVTAVSAAIDIQERMARFNEALAAEQRPARRLDRGAAQRAAGRRRIRAARGGGRWAKSSP